MVKFKFHENKLIFNNFKSSLKLVKTAQVSGNNRFSLTFNEDQLFKGLIGDIEYYHARTLVQYANLIRSFQHISPCWNVVSQYYFSFFSATTCLRLLHRGNTYLDTSYARELTEIIQILSGEVVKLNTGNYTFQISPIQGTSDLNLELSLSKNGTHEQTWITLHEFIKDLLNDSTRDDEYTVLSILNGMARDFGSTFPSKLRNKVNYQPVYGLQSIRNYSQHFNRADINLKNWTKEILSFESRPEEDHQIRMSALYGYYFFMLMTKLYDDYINRGKIRGSLFERNKQYFTRFNIEIPVFPEQYV